ncbi:MAG: outer membrane protein assembly factor BamB family protein, partial [Planctomycetota bacterium]
MTKRIRNLGLCVCLLFAAGGAELLAADWPQLGYATGHCAATPDDLPKQLRLKWVRQLHKPRPAWPPSQFRMRFDVSYLPVAAGKRLFVPSMVTDSVAAYDTETGRLLWRFFADGPVRLAPIAHAGKVYFGADDGWLYCVNAADGSLKWRFAARPTERRVIGHGRLISTWPVRGGPVLFKDRIYLTAGIWPFMGIFAHCVDVKTGRGIWYNAGAGQRFMDQPHKGAAAFAGFVPRGQLAATERGIIAPGGRTLPGCYDLKTGRLRYFQFGARYTGGSGVAARGNFFFFCWGQYAISNGKQILGNQGSVHTAKASYGIRHKAGSLFAQPLGPAAPKKGRQQSTTATSRGDDRAAQPPPLAPEGPWDLPLEKGLNRLYLKAGSRFYVGGKDVVAAVEVNLEKRTADIVWRSAIRGEPWTMLAADEKLFVVTKEGRLYCFGEGRATARTYGNLEKLEPEKTALPVAGQWKRNAEEILDAAGVREGYALVLGLGTGQLAKALVDASKLQVIAIDPDAEKIAAFRRRMDDAGLYGTRISAHVGDPISFDLPPYVASLIVSEEAPAAGMERDKAFVEKVFKVLRPYGGAAYFPTDAKKLGLLAEQARLAGARVRSVGKTAAMLVREGAPAGSADWTHQYADAANTVCSRDELVKLPMGLLWFGGPSNDAVLPRHGHGPAPQVAAGRLFIEGRNMLRAIDIYTGRLLWQKELKDLGKFYDNTHHQAGANKIGSNYVSLPDAVYVIYGRKILKLDPETGETVAEFRPPFDKGRDPPYWGYVGAWEELLIASCGPVALAKGGFNSAAPYAEASKRLVVMNRHSGKVL